jgi:hypothetical protein
VVGHGQAQERSAIATRQGRIRRIRRRTRPGEVAHDDGIDPWVQRLDPADGGVDQFTRGNLTLRQGGGEFAGRLICERFRCSG